MLMVFMIISFLLVIKFQLIVVITQSSLSYAVRSGCYLKSLQ